MKITKIRNIIRRIIPILVISLSALFASAQPGGHLSSYENDTVKTSSLNRSTYEIYDRNKQLIQRVHLKKKEKHGYTEIYQNGVLVEKTRYKKGLPV